MLYLGIKVSKSTYAVGDNHSVIINSTVQSLLLKKKHFAISYHLTREATAVKKFRPLKIKSVWNFTDFITKVLTKKLFASIVDGILL